MTPLTHQERLGLLVVAAIFLAAIAAHLFVPSPTAWTALPADSGLDEVRAQTADETEAARRRAVPLAPGERIDLNLADATELARLPGIGPVLAERVVAWREGRGGVFTPEELLEVSGIGPAKYAALEDRVMVDGATAPRRAPPASLASGAGSAAIDVNRASPEELTRLPGVGPVLAERIVASREADGPFGSPEELSRVSGIGSATVARIAPHAAFGRP